MEPLVRNVTLYEGNDATLPILLSNIDGTPYDLTGAAVQFGIAVKLDLTPFVIHSTEDGTILLPQGRTGGKIVIPLNYADTVNRPGDWVYDVRITTAAGKRATLVRGSFTVPGVVIK